ncbi:MAG: hypothetical protein WED07_02210 [Candidatus Freyarchaeum deiterrae]
MKDAIPKDIALRLCEEIRLENASKKLGAGKSMCHFCYNYSIEHPGQLCVFANEENRGCYQVNKRYDKLHKKR